MIEGNSGASTKILQSAICKSLVLLIAVGGNDNADIWQCGSNQLENKTFYQPERLWRNQNPNSAYLR